MSKKPVPETTEPVEPTDDEIAIAKAQRSLQGLVHIDAKDALLQYVFPLLRKLAKTDGDQEEAIEDLNEDLVKAASAIGGAVANETLALHKDALDVILKLAGLLDTALVAGGLYVVVPNKGLKATEKALKVLSQDDHADLTSEVVEIARDLKDAIDALESGDGDGDADGDAADGEGAEAPTGDADDSLADAASVAATAAAQTAIESAQNDVATVNGEAGKSDGA